MALKRNSLVPETPGSSDRKYPHYALPTYSSIRKSKTSQFYAYPFTDVINRLSVPSSSQANSIRSPTRQSLPSKQQLSPTKQPDKIYPSKRITSNFSNNETTTLSFLSSKFEPNVIPKKSESSYSSVMKKGVWNLFEKGIISDDSDSFTTEPLSGKENGDQAEYFTPPENEKSGIYNLIGSVTPINKNHGNQSPGVEKCQETIPSESPVASGQTEQDDIFIFDDFNLQNPAINQVAKNLIIEAQEAVNKSENIFEGSSQQSMPLREISSNSGFFVPPEVLVKSTGDREMIPVAEYLEVVKQYRKLWDLMVESQGHKDF